MDDVGVVLKGELKDQALATMSAMTEAAQGLKAELRGQVTGAGLGVRLGNTWRSRVYPQTGASVEAAALVWTKAPKLIDAFNRDLWIGPDGGRYRAIPTDNVPPSRRRGQISGRMTPHEVELSFNQDLVIRQGKGRHKLAFVDVVAGRSRGFRQATRRRLAQGRVRKLVLMFTLVPEPTHNRKRLDVDGAAERWADKVPGLIVNRWRD